MKDEQLERLEAVKVKLIDAAVIEADPDNWPGSHCRRTGEKKLPGQYTREERGDRYWCKKNAVATLAIISKIESLAYFKNRGHLHADAYNDEVDVDKEVSQYEQAAQQALERYEARVANLNK